MTATRGLFFDEPAILRAFGAEIIEQRTNRGMTQADLAHASGLSQPSISDYESGIRNPMLTTLIRLAAGLGMQPAHLIAAVTFRRRPAGDQP